jgi:hypothetical protein
LIATIVFSGIWFAIQVRNVYQESDQELRQRTSIVVTAEETLEVIDPEEQSPLPLEVSPAPEPEPEPQPAPQPTPTVNPQQYRNPFFTFFQINYNDSWAFNTVTFPSQFSGLLERRITLTKGSTTITFYFTPPYVSGCGPFNEPPEAPFVANINGTSFSRYDFGAGGDIYIQSNSPSYVKGCTLAAINEIDTSIVNQGFTNYARSSFSIDVLSADGTMKYWAFVSVKGAEHVFEADQIIANSVIR